jgi:YidC/Oxa1 family membrane protein insertase
MEKRALLAIALSIAVLVLWQALLAPPPAPRKPPAPRAAHPAPPPVAAVPVEGLVARPSPREASAEPRVAHDHDLETPFYRVQFGRDGEVTRWVLSYRGPKELVVGRNPGPLAVGVSGPGRPTELVALEPTAGEGGVPSGVEETALRFAGRTSQGVEVEKTLRLRRDSYRIGVDLRVRVPAGVQAGALTLTLYWTAPVAVPGTTPGGAWVTIGHAEGDRQVLGRILVAHGEQLEAFDPPSPALEDPKESGGQPALKDPRPVAPALVVPGPRGWVALENDYFIAALLGAEGAQLLRARDPQLAEVGLVFPELRLAPGESWTGQAALYVGPKEWNRLAALGVGLEQAQARNYGGFPFPLPYGIPMQWFCVPLLWLMNFFATHVPGQNYGVAIILLTVLVKIAFYPLTQKSMRSMKQMQALQPQLNALRARYRSDPQRFQREQMELFRKHRVNPMGGCLPMIVQIPIFYALYLTIQYSVELQGAPFVLWIRDLSKMDPYYVLPILMGISMLVQQLMTPTVGDPRQARVMLIMPVIFTVMFIQFPTGLVLYWLVNNLLSIAQQYLLDRAARRLPLPLVEAKVDKGARKA